MGRNGSMPSDCEVDWEEADTAVRVAVLKSRQDHADEDRDELRRDVATVKSAFLPDGIVGKVASDLKTIKFLGWFLLASVPASITVIGALLAGVLWLIRHAPKQ